jgi:hypothetical protein
MSASIFENEREMNRREPVKIPKEGNKMKKIMFLGWVFLFLPAMVSGQEKVEAPVWNVGDKWVFDREGPMEVIGNDTQCYSVKFSGGIFPKGDSGIALFEKSTLNVKYMLNKDRRKEYRGFRKKILNFPLTLGKQWEDGFQRNEIGNRPGMGSADYQETYRGLGWEEVEVRAGKFKAIKVEYKMVRSFGPLLRDEYKAWYWYSPGVKNLVKCKYDKGYTEGNEGRKDWELVSYELKK